MKKILYTVLAMGLLFYLVNPTAGILELIPDNIPVLGNIDEAVITYVLISILEYLLNRKLTKSL